MNRLLAIAAVLCLASSAAKAQVVRVNLQLAPPTDISRELERALGAPVEIRGGVGRKITLDLAAASPALVLDRVSALMGGTWRTKLHVRPAQAGTEPSPSPRPVVDRSLAIGIQDLPAARAFALLARELRADLELEGALETRVSQPAVSLPVTVLLDRLSRQANAAWSIRYVITASDAPPDPEAVEREPSFAISPNPSPTPISAPRRPAGIGLAAPLAGSALRDALRADVSDLLRADSSAREQAVRQFVATAEKRILALASLPASERISRLRAARSVLVQWRRLYAGLAPNLKLELRPAAVLLEKELG